jgi:CPA2 family monovalent cation:H+ antiporter-2
MTLAAAFGLALVFGFIAAGPVTPGVVADASIAAQLAEVGVMLLMFGVGLHFSGYYALCVTP